MDIRKLQRAIVDGLEDVKAQDIVIFNTEHLSPLFERVIVASGTSNRQTKALAASVRDEVRKQGFEVMRTEGEENGEWIIVDCGAAVAHIMQPTIRQYYHLEEIWGEKPVKMKIGAAKALPKASGDGAVGTARKAPARGRAEQRDEAAADQQDDRAAPNGKSASRSAKPRAQATDKPAAPRPAAKAAAKKAAPARTPAAKTPARKAAAKTTGTASGRKVSARATPSKTVVVNAPAKPVARKTAAAKPAARPAAKTAAKTPAKAAAPRSPAAKAPAAKGAARKTR